MLENEELTPKEKMKMKKILIGVALFVGAYLGAKKGSITKFLKNHQIILLAGLYFLFASF